MGRKLANRMHSESGDQCFYSHWLPDTSGVSQVQITSPTQFNILINDLDDRIKSTLPKFADVTKRGGEVSM